MLNRLIKYSAPTAKHDDQRRGALLNILLFGVGVIALLSIITMFFLEVAGVIDESFSLYLVIIGLLTGTIGIYFLNQSGKVLLSSSVFLVVITIAISFADTPEELLAGRSLFFFIIPVMMASFLLRSNASFIVAGLLSIEHLLLWNLADVQIDFSIFGIMGFFVFALITWLAARTLENALYESREINLRLDELVEERTTELAKTNVELASANERLTELDSLKSKFVSDVSHELRTPISNISIYLEMTEASLSTAPNIPERVMGFLKILREETLRLSSLITNVLDISRLEKDMSELNLQQVDANKIIEDVFQANRLMAEAKGLEFSFTPFEALPQLLVDPDQLKRVFTNLIANAINYTPKGSVKLSSSLSDNNEFVFRVQDTGMGIASEDTKHLFERFYRGDRASLSSIPGTGLGLAITKEIVEAHNGTINIESEVEVGTIFTAYFPINTLDRRK